MILFRQFSNETLFHENSDTACQVCLPLIRSFGSFSGYRVQVTPIFKGGRKDRRIPVNYRPICHHADTVNPEYFLNEIK